MFGFGELGGIGHDGGSFAHNGNQSKTAMSLTANFMQVCLLIEITEE